MSAETLNATMIERRDISDTHAIIRLRPDTPPVRAFTPGQFITVGLPLPARSRGGDAPSEGTRLVKRAYSIASSPLETEYYELFLAVVPDGRLTPELWQLEIGDRCWISSDVHGSFTLDDIPHDAHLVLVATGTGVAPYVSMLRTHQADERWQSVALVHGARRALDLGYQAELEERARQDPRAVYIPVVSRETDEAWKGLRGRVQVALAHESFPNVAGFDLDPLRCHALLCGNPAMIQDVRALLETHGFTAQSSKEKGNLHFERYW
jgi:ferredoxin--NADP+ reductase